MQTRRVKPNWCKPRIRSVRWSNGFVKEIIEYAIEVLRVMEEKGCIKFVRRGDRIEGIEVKIECNEWYVENPIKVNITISNM